MSVLWEQVHLMKHYFRCKRHSVHIWSHNTHNFNSIPQWFCVSWNILTSFGRQLVWTTQWLFIFFYPFKWLLITTTTIFTIYTHYTCIHYVLLSEFPFNVTFLLSLSSLFRIFFIHCIFLFHFLIQSQYFLPISLSILLSFSWPLSLSLSISVLLSSYLLFILPHTQFPCLIPSHSRLISLTSSTHSINFCHILSLSQDTFC